MSTQPTKEPTKDIRCDICDKTFLGHAGLGAHRRAAHGIAGKSSTAKKHQLTKEKKDGRAKGKEGGKDGGEGSGSGSAKGELRKVGRKPREDSPEVFHGGIPETTLAVAYGRFIEFSKGLALEYDVPARQFAREFTALICRSSVR